MRLQDNLGRKMTSDYKHLEWVVPLTIVDGEIDEQIVKMKGAEPTFISYRRDGHKSDPPGVQRAWIGENDEWEPWTPPTKIVSALPLPIEALMKKFGCHEPQTRELVRELIKLIKEK